MRREIYSVSEDRQLFAWWRRGRSLDIEWATSGDLSEVASRLILKLIGMGWISDQMTISTYLTDSNESLGIKVI